MAQWLLGRARGGPAQQQTAEQADAGAARRSSRSLRWTQPLQQALIAPRDRRALAVERVEVQDALAHVALVANPHDARAFRRAVGTPTDREQFRRA